MKDVSLLLLARLIPLQEARDLEPYGLLELAPASDNCTGCSIQGEGCRGASGNRRSPVKIWRKSKIHALNLPLCVRDVFLATHVSQKNSPIKYSIQQEKTIQPDCHIEARDALQLRII
jgi:hypothetical protein